MLRGAGRRTVAWRGGRTAGSARAVGSMSGGVAGRVVIRSIVIVVVVIVHPVVIIPCVVVIVTQIVACRVIVKADL